MPRLEDHEFEITDDEEPQRLPEPGPYVEDLEEMDEADHELAGEPSLLAGARPDDVDDDVDDDDDYTDFTVDEDGVLDPDKDYD